MEKEERCAREFIAKDDAMGVKVLLVGNGNVKFLICNIIDFPKLL